MSILRSLAALVAAPALATAVLAQPTPPAQPAATPSTLDVISRIPLPSGPPPLAPIPAPTSAPIPAPPSPLGIAPYPPPPGPTTTLASFLGISDQQIEYRRRAQCRTPFGQLRAAIRAPFSRLTGGLIPPFCPEGPSLAELQDPGPVGAAAKAKLDRLNAKERIEAIEYLGTLDCHYWPEAEDALVNSLRADRNEWVRLAAAKTLGKGCCCTKKTITALSLAATCSNADGNPAEKSPKVVAAAQASLSKCVTALCCNPIITEGVIVPDVGGGGEGQKGEGEGVSVSKSGVGGEGKGSGGLAIEKTVRPTGKAFYDKVSERSWGEVLAFAKNALATAPAVSADEATAAGLEIETASATTSSPASTTDVPVTRPVTTTTEIARVAPVQPMSQGVAVYRSAGFGIQTNETMRYATANRPTAPVTRKIETNGSRLITMLGQPTPAPSLVAEIAKISDDELTTDAKLTTALLKAAENSDNAEVRTACLRALGRCKSSTPVIVAGLERLVNDRDVDVRIEAAVALNQIKGSN